MLDGPAEDYTLGDTRQAIVRHLREVEAATPKQLADSLSLNYNTAKVTVKRMSDDGQLDTDGRGNYFLPVQPVTPVTDVTHGQGYTGYGGFTPGESHDPLVPHLVLDKDEVTASCGHPVKVVNTTNGRCAVCIVDSLSARSAS
jgi:hypothetical protein